MTARTQLSLQLTRALSLQLLHPSYRNPNWNERRRETNQRRPAESDPETHHRRCLLEVLRSDVLINRPRLEHDHDRNQRDRCHHENQAAERSWNLSGVLGVELREQRAEAEREDRKSVG